MTDKHIVLNLHIINHEHMSGNPHEAFYMLVIFKKPVHVFALRSLIDHV